MEKERSNKGAWIIIALLSVILVVGLLWDQPMKKEEAIERVKELVPAEFEYVHSTEFILARDNEWGLEIWNIQLENSEKDLASVMINADNGRLLYGVIEDGETGEILKEL